MDNKMRLEFLAKSENEGFARVSVSAFIAQLDPTIEELTDIKTAVSEAVTNAIIHGYECDESKVVIIEASICEDEISITVIATGFESNQIQDMRINDTISKFTTKPVETEVEKKEVEPIKEVVTAKEEPKRTSLVEEDDDMIIPTFLRRRR